MSFFGKKLGEEKLSEEKLISEETISACIKALLNDELEQEYFYDKPVLAEICYSVLTIRHAYHHTLYTYLSSIQTEKRIDYHYDRINELEEELEKSKKRIEALERRNFITCSGE